MRNDTGTHPMILEVKALIKSFPGVTAVDGISFSIPSGTCFGLLGPNGAGKTTTIEVIEGILPPTAGVIHYKGRKRGKCFREEVGIQLQSTELPMYLTVRETLTMFRSLYGRKSEFDPLIRLCQLEDLLDRDNKKISGGQKQRLLLAMALANDPKLLFLDEPTTGLDPQARRHLWEIVARLKAQGTTIVLTTHYMEEAELLCDDIAIMDRGKIIAQGSPAALLETGCNESAISLPDVQLDNDLMARAGLTMRQNAKDNPVYYTTNSNKAIQVLAASDVSLKNITIRSENLEDLFIKLTGHELRS